MHCTLSNNDITYRFSQIKIDASFTHIINKYFSCNIVSYYIVYLFAVVSIGSKDSVVKFTYVVVTQA